MSLFPSWRRLIARWRDFYGGHARLLRWGALSLLVFVSLLLLYGEKKGFPLSSASKADPLQAEAELSSDQETSGRASSEEEPDNQPDGEQAPKENHLLCDISGAIHSAGVYDLPVGSRLCDLIEKAGGLTEEADINAINRAFPLRDGQKIYIPEQAEGKPPCGAVGREEAKGADLSESASSCVDINQADSATLQTLPGVGPATADRIIAYREKEGPFGSPEDIKQVPGIGEKKFEKIKDRIVV